ncbi:MAG: hypothetical protein JWL95_13, partial [Gemmatimonadetes bacterium]|nr:hypothetical protein [Gemmatimonadota bacterium]
MTARDRLLRLQRTLAITLAMRALLVGAATAMAVVAVVRLLGLPMWNVVLALLVGTGIAGVMLLRMRGVRSLSRVALWVEERTPSLRYSLVTVADGVQSPSVDAQALSAPWWSDAQRTLLKALLVPGLAALLAVALAMWAPLAQRITGAGSVASSAAKAARVTDVLAVVRVAVTPPSYSGRPATTVDDPTSIETLVGSVITVSGNGDAKQLTATADST